MLNIHITFIGHVHGILIVIPFIPVELKNSIWGLGGVGKVAKA